jgi:hypothetical protein
MSPKSKVFHSDQARANMSIAHLGKSLSVDHRKAISESCTGRQLTEEHRTAISIQMKSNHPRSYTWVLIDPSNTLHTTNKIQDFCTQYSLAYSVLRYKAQQNDGTPITRGPSAGWIVFGVKKNRQ